MGTKVKCPKMVRNTNSRDEQKRRKKEMEKEKEEEEEDKRIIVLTCLLCPFLLLSILIASIPA